MKLENYNQKNKVDKLQMKFEYKPYKPYLFFLISSSQILLVVLFPL